MTRTKLPNHDEWLAAEYALGVLSGDERNAAEIRCDRDGGFRAAVDGWHNQLEPILSDVVDVRPPASVFKAIEKEIGVSAERAHSQAKGVGIWKWLAGLSTGLAAVCVAALLFVTGGDITGSTINNVRVQLVASNERATTLSRSLDAAQSTAASTAGELDAVRQQIASVIAEREGSIQQLAVLEEKLLRAEQDVVDYSQQLVKLETQVNSSVPLVASLTPDGSLPIFVAQYDPLRQSLFIRTSATNEDERVPEVWFIPNTGVKKGEVLSLGVMNETAPDRIPIEAEFVQWMGEGGTLAITMEQAGGSPTGVATGPVIAVGKLQTLR